MRRDPFAVAALVCGVLWLCWIGSVLAVVFGHLARRRIRRDGGRGRVMASFGLAFGYAGLVFLLFTLLQGGSLWVAPAR
ncbi:DUF4190 domain-containing protein [Actinocorallia sp. API 0066]|uniref:DUF4190 domain-containing protein n=1 Tax=Actinocorallia sp. API 0066 TaxID=2896846 RepID=UPI001E5FB05A|nr:DUF4190 domain-containing protein [Actinocorallia sp. API 0066]MCD0453223.1 DUF4190 domain-containing protein [Actinocorallia sp. API 0066]